MAVNYTVKYTKDGVAKTYTHSFDTEPTFDEVNALADNFEHDSIEDYVREDS